MRNLKQNLLIILSTFLLSSCISSTTIGGVGSDRSQLMLVGYEEMDNQAQQAYSEILADAKNKGVLDKDTKLTKRIQKIAKELISHTGQFRPDALNWNWEVHTITSPTLNAWCMPGGRIVVYSGLVEKLKLNDAEIAAIMGHEMAHALREHSRERASQEQAKLLGISVLTKIINMNGLEQMALNLAAKYTITLPFSRSNETEADLIGAELMARAGYDPKSAIDVWKKMSAQNQSHPLEILSTHPSPDTRIKDLEKAIVKLEPIYNQSKKKGKKV